MSIHGSQISTNKIVAHNTNLMIQMTHVKHTHTRCIILIKCDEYLLGRFTLSTVI